MTLQELAQASYMATDLRAVGVRVEIVNGKIFVEGVHMRFDEFIRWGNARLGRSK